MPTQQEIAVINAWQIRLQQEGIEFHPNYVSGNLGLILGFVENNLGGISEANLDVAAKATWAALKFKPGKAMPDPRAAEKARADAAARHARGEVHQSRIKHELDDDAPSETAVKNEAQRALTRKQLEYKEAFEFACNSYQCYRLGRVNFSKTQERREQLRSIVVPKLAGILRYDQAVERAKETVAKWERQDSQVTW